MGLQEKAEDNYMISSYHLTYDCQGFICDTEGCHYKSSSPTNGNMMAQTEVRLCTVAFTKYITVNTKARTSWPPPPTNRNMIA
jgi:hypothetical protein